MSNAGGMATITRYTDMLAGNATWNPWEPQGAFDALSTVTVGAGGVASIEFAGIPQGYKHLQIRYIARGSSSDNVFYLRCNSDSTSGNYANHLLYGDGSSAAASASLTEPGTTYVSLSNSSRLASTFAAGVVDILDYANTNKYKTQRALTGREDNSAGIVILASGLWKNTAAITSVSCVPVTGNFAEYSQFTLYGIR
jgi:hypothetical protein